ncbi:aspartate/glutamate racemase family protein [Paenibacillus glycanilyticus]|uniref:aspartate/glutamate racemase family protein n=1 Tax=Paenibacillus glycanilyticus TaxID=126569 RepID=UPI0019102C53|nr:aspartate/glutamate racemase family protein [Paenibacillus glycanilyticus]
MSQTRIGLVHATLNSVQPINEAFREVAPDVKVLNFLDESLIEDLNQQGIVTTDLINRLADLIGKAEKSKVDGILLTCSSFSANVPELKSLFRVPLLSADYAMLEQAIEEGSRIGVIATVPAAGPVTEKQLLEIAEKRDKQVTILTEIIPEAFQALQEGKAELHDAFIHARITQLSKSCDVILLAQFSMARAVKSLPGSRVPVLTSPEISIKKILSVIS